MSPLVDACETSRVCFRLHSFFSALSLSLFSSSVYLSIRLSTYLPVPAPLNPCGRPPSAGLKKKASSMAENRVNRFATREF